VHVGHLTFETMIPHDCGRKDDGEVLGRHLMKVNARSELGSADALKHTKFSLSLTATRAR
jgi:hypothetical protein